MKLQYALKKLEQLHKGYCSKCTQRKSQSLYNSNQKENVEVLTSSQLKNKQINSEIRQLDAKFSQIKKNINGTSKVNGKPKMQLLNLLTNKFGFRHLEEIISPANQLSLQKQNQKEGRFQPKHLLQKKRDSQYSLNSSKKQNKLNKTFGHSSRDHVKYDIMKSEHYEKQAYKNQCKKDENNLFILFDSSLSMESKDQSSIIRNQKSIELFSGGVDLEDHRLKKLKLAADPSQFIRVQRCYSGYSTPRNSQKKDIPKPFIDQNGTKNISHALELCEKLKLRKSHTNRSRH